LFVHDEEATIGRPGRRPSVDFARVESDGCLVVEIRDLESGSLACWRVGERHREEPAVVAESKSGHVGLQHASLSGFNGHQCASEALIEVGVQHTVGTKSS